MKILISGGHLTPALAFIDYVKKHTDDTVVFAGRLYSQNSAHQQSQEQSEVAKRNVLFIPFDGVRIRQQDTMITKIMRPISLFKATLQAFSVFKTHQPDVFLSFGGYLAVPLAIAAKCKGIPVITHEQTRTSGFANQFIGTLANKVALTFPESQRYFSTSKTVLTGNPVRQEILKTETQRPTWISQELSQPLLLITCGNQGSHTINLIVGQALAELTKEWAVIHLAGNPTKDVNYVEYLEKAKQGLPEKQQANYFVRAWTSGDDLAWVYTHATAAIARSGANTLQELVLRQIPTLFIPLPFAHRDEQLLNATALVEKEAALILKQQDLTPATLIHSLRALKEQAVKIKAKLAQQNYAVDGDHKLYELVTAVYHAH